MLSPGAVAGWIHLHRHIPPCTRNSTTAALLGWFIGWCAGLAATLGLIKDKGMLKDTTQWAGRNNDKKALALIGLEDVYTGEGCVWCTAV
jgi:hypothetical protein